MKNIKTISIPHALGIIYSVILLVMLIQGKLEEGVNYVAIWPVYLMLIYSFIVFVFSLITVPLYWLTLPFRKYFIKKGKLTEQHDAKIKLFFITATLLVALYGLYLCFFPTEDTFLADFKKVTYRDLHPSASLIDKDSDFFSECTGAVIQMTPKHYIKLLNQLQSDYRFESSRATGKSYSFFDITEEYSKDDITHTFAHPNTGPGTNHSTYHIGFFANQKWVVYRYCLNR